MKLGAPLDREGEARRPDATTIARALGDGCDQGEYDDALCAWTGARARRLRPGMRRYLRIDGKAVRGAAPHGGREECTVTGVRMLAVTGLGTRGRNRERDHLGQLAEPATGSYSAWAAGCEDSAL
ncbi:MAG: hypothetical protein M3Y33_04250 [Actinomycetota bacterium]|nr:hypothetical protein [Actinomycetota bacterium]